MIDRLHRNLRFGKGRERSTDSIELTDAMVTIMTNAFRMHFLFEKQRESGIASMEVSYQVCGWFDDHTIIRHDVRHTSKMKTRKLNSSILGLNLVRAKGKKQRDRNPIC